MGRNRRIIITHSAEETLNLGMNFGLEIELKKNIVVCLSGEVGAGKTTFVKGVVHAITGILPNQVVSPTFVYLRIYKNVYHFDLYRLDGCEEFLSLGFEEYLFAGGICFIEWSEKIISILPKRAIFVNLSHLTEESREISISKS
ncbi:MAG: tRNA (adenosine(37)-N6)-threonylcarbamoyltransferase complex ATPase subunit type 1 TsaE [Chlamydiales bacterium]